MLGTRFVAVALRHAQMQGVILKASEAIRFDAFIAIDRSNSSKHSGMRHRAFDKVHFPDNILFL